MPAPSHDGHRGRLAGCHRWREVGPYTSATNDWENDGLAPFAETMKQVHGADRERCMTDREVGGWHPASRWCGGCRLAEPCRSRLRPGVADRRIAAAARGER